MESKALKRHLRVAFRVRICLGGTFDRLHVGHEALLAKAFEVGDEVFIGLTSQRLAQGRRTRRVKSFEVRRRNLEALLRRHGWKGVVSEIDHPFGRSVERRYQGIVVSPETLARVVEINRARRKKGYPLLRVFTIPFFYGNDGLRISSTRIAAGEIDPRGRRRTAVTVAVGTKNVLKRRAVEDAFRAAFPDVKFRIVAKGVPSGVPEQPFGEETFRGADARARRVLAGVSGADYGVGIEAGLVAHEFLGRHLDVQHVVVVDKDGARTASHGGGFYYPSDVEAEVLKGKTISQVLGPRAKDRRLGSTTGAVGFLSDGRVDRRELTRHGVLLALVPRIRRDLYQE